MRMNKTLLDLDIEELARIRKRIVRHSFAYGNDGAAEEQIFNLSEEILSIINRLKSISKTLSY